MTKAARVRPILAGKTIRIGVGTTLSGVTAPLGREMKQAAEIAVEECNADGGILGATVEVETRNDEGAAEAARSAARAFCKRGDLLGVVGHFNTDTSLPACEICEPERVVMITPIASEPELTGDGRRHLFRFTNSDDHTGRAIANHLLRELGKRRAVVVATRSTYGKSMTRRFVEPFVAGGGEVLHEHWVDDGEREFASVIAAIPGDADVIFYGGAFEGAPLLKAMRAGGLNQLFAAGDGCWDRWNFLEPVGEAAGAGKGVLVLSATPQVGRVPGSETFADRYAQRHGPIGNYAVNSYDSTKALLTAIGQAAAAKGGMPDRDDVFSALRLVDYRGIAYPEKLRWSGSNDNTAAVTALHSVKNGAFRQVAQISQ
jgi:branched-chain amino acid transport system substrate-binding protein